MGSAEFARALEGTREIELTVTGRRSGRDISLPVWFVQQGEKLDLLPVMGSDTQWFKNVLQRRTIRLTARGVDYRTEASPVTDAKGVSEIVEEFRNKYGPRQRQHVLPQARRRRRGVPHMMSALGPFKASPIGCLLLGSLVASRH
jgi:hypothetical protein